MTVEIMLLRATPLESRCNGLVSTTRKVMLYMVSGNRRDGSSCRRGLEDGGKVVAEKPAAWAADEIKLHVYCSVDELIVVLLGVARISSKEPLPTVNVVGGVTKMISGGLGEND